MNQDILEKAIQKAKDSGWHEQKWQGGLYEKEPGIYLPIYGIIFSHDFAKSLFGEAKVYTVGDGEPLGGGYHALLHPLIPRWEFHLREMVVSPDPIKYLEESL